MMYLLRLTKTALTSLDAHFLRSLLATLGVLIGVGSVVACMSILEGASNVVLDRFKTLGSNLIFIQPATARIQGRPVGQAQTLDLDDLETIERDLFKSVERVAPQALGTANIKYFQKSDTFTVIATSDVYFEMNAYEAEMGQTFTAAESRDELANVVVLGSKVAGKLFGGMNAVGQVIKLNNTGYRVVGVMEERGTVGFLDADSSVYIPIRYGLKRFFNRTYLSWIAVAAREGVDLDALKKQIQSLLRRNHNIRVGQPDDFEVQTLEETVQSVGQLALILKAVFYSIAGISLVVGGIGIMNIMLVSVTERTREIGVRMAVGAQRQDILAQFLIEALIISVLGGGFGLLLGTMLADIVEKVLDGMFPTQISATVIMTAVVTTTIVGVFSGIYPAYKASRLDPVEALRYE